MNARLRKMLAVLLACAVWTGCSNVWDGEYTPLKDVGDNVDTGPLAPCRVRGEGSHTPECGSLESFDLSACDRETLEDLEPEGIYGVRTRAQLQRSGAEVVEFDFNGLKLSAQGEGETANGYPVTHKQVDDRTFYVSSLRTRPDGGTVRYAYAGCEAQDSRRLSGCYQVCQNGTGPVADGTFDAERLKWKDRERSGLALVSEHEVGRRLPVDVYVAGKYAYVVAINRPPLLSGGLIIFDVSDRARPVLHKTMLMLSDSYWNGVWARGNALYVASASRGLLVFDISDPANPTFLRNLPGEPANVHTVHLEGDRLYAQETRGNQVLIYDVSRPTEPVLLGRYQAQGDDGDVRGYPHDVFAYQGRLYVNQMHMGYVVADVAEPAQPRTLGMYSYASQSTARASTTHANAVGTFGGRTIAFEGGESVGAHLRALDVTDPAKIQLVGEVRMRQHTSIHNMVLVGERLYVAWYAEGLRVFDVSDPTDMEEVAHYNTFRETDPNRTDSLYQGAMAVRVPGDGYIYVVDSARGLLILRED